MRRILQRLSFVFGRTRLPSGGFMFSTRRNQQNVNGHEKNATIHRDVAYTRSVVDETAMGNAQTNTAPFCPRLTTHDGRQFLAYWDDDAVLHVARRDLPAGSWQTRALDVETGLRDGHYTPAVGVGPDGHLFLCYNTRNSPIRWRRSDAPGEISFGEERVGMTDSNEDSACYPEFTRLLDGTLLFGYRNGKSGDGDWQLNRWTADGWQPLHHPLTDGEGERNSYHWNLVQSADGTVHYFFCWRNNARPGVGNSDLCYARSPDGGESWERSDGRGYSLPVTRETAEVVDGIDVQNNFINQGWASFDPETSYPHVAYYRDDDEGNTQIYHTYDTGESWVVERVTDRDTDVYPTEEFRSTDPRTLGRPGIVADDDGSVHILTRDAERGGWPLLLSKVDGEWNATVLYRRNLVHADVHIDPERWRTDRVLSFIDQPQSTLSFDPVGGAPWNDGTLLGVTDVSLDRMDASGRRVAVDAADTVTVTSTGVGTPVSIDWESFQRSPASVTFSESTLPATPALARFTATIRGVTSDSAAEFRLAFENLAGDADERATTRAVRVEEATGPIRTTGWVSVPRALRAGVVTVQTRVDHPDQDVRLTDGTLELGYRDPRPSLDEILAG